MKPKPLPTRLRSARILLRERRRVIHQCHVEPATGKVDEPTERELARFDAACEALGEAIKVVKEAQR